MCGNVERSQEGRPRVAALNQTVAFDATSSQYLVLGLKLFLALTFIIVSLGLFSKPAFAFAVNDNVVLDFDQANKNKILGGTGMLNLLGFIAGSKITGEGTAISPYRIDFSKINALGNDLKAITFGVRKNSGVKVEPTANSYVTIKGANNRYVELTGTTVDSYTNEWGVSDTISSPEALFVIEGGNITFETMTVKNPEHGDYAVIVKNNASLTVDNTVIQAANGLDAYIDSVTEGKLKLARGATNRLVSSDSLAAGSNGSAVVATSSTEGWKNLVYFSIKGTNSEEAYKTNKAAAQDYAKQYGGTVYAVDEDGTPAIETPVTAETITSIANGALASLKAQINAVEGESYATIMLEGGTEPASNSYDVKIQITRPETSIDTLSEQVTAVLTNALGQEGYPIESLKWTNSSYANMAESAGEAEIKPATVVNDGMTLKDAIAKFLKIPFGTWWDEIDGQEGKRPQEIGQLALDSSGESSKTITLECTGKGKEVSSQDAMKTVTPGDTVTYAISFTKGWEHDYPAPVYDLAISPATASIQADGTQDYSLEVSNTNNTVSTHPVKFDVTLPKELKVDGLSFTSNVAEDTPQAENQEKAAEKTVSSKGIPEETETKESVFEGTDTAEDSTRREGTLSEDGLSYTFPSLPANARFIGKVSVSLADGVQLSEKTNYNITFNLKSNTGTNYAEAQTVVLTIEPVSEPTITPDPTVPTTPSNSTPPAPSEPEKTIPDQMADAVTGKETTEIIKEAIQDVANVREATRDNTGNVAWTVELINTEVPVTEIAHGLVSNVIENLKTSVARAKHAIATSVQDPSIKALDLKKATKEARDAFSEACIRAAVPSDEIVPLANNSVASSADVENTITMADDLKDMTTQIDINVGDADVIYTFSFVAKQESESPTNPDQKPQKPNTSTETIDVYRLWNRLNGAHLITSDLNECKTLSAQTSENGWVNEGVKFSMPKESAIPIWRLWNEHNGDHLYTASEHEYNKLCELGWTGEGVKLFGESAAAGVPVYRLYNSEQTIEGGLGAHLWTADSNEYQVLPTIEPVGAWQQEDIAWYATKVIL